MQKVVKEQENLDLIEGMVEDLVIEDQTVKGVILMMEQLIYRKLLF